MEVGKEKVKTLIRGQDIPRRQFLSLSARAAALTFGAALVGLPHKSAGAMEIPDYATVLDQVRTAHRALSAFPSNPVAVAYDPKVTAYPTKDLLPYDGRSTPRIPSSKRP